nr:N-acetylmuramoyl-L-alanine amidase [candidate division Zixibacteria bacterium]
MIRIFRLPVIFAILLISAVVVSAQPIIKVIYPKKGSPIGAVDSTFILGSVTPGSTLEINGVNINVHRDGGFIAFLPLNPGPFDFELEAVNGYDTTFLGWPVLVPQPMKSLPYDSLVIIDKTRTSGNMILGRGDQLRVEIQATPGCFAYFSIPGYIESVPMAEGPPRIQPFWGEAVFGSGAVPESLKIKGYYSGYLDIDDKCLVDSSRVIYHLRAPSFLEMWGRTMSRSLEDLDFGSLELLKFKNDRTIDSSRFFVIINPDNYPCLVEFTDSVQIMRIGPRQGYLAIFQPKGVKAMAVGREGDWVKLKLSETQFGWVNINSIKFLKKGLPSPKSLLKSIRAFAGKDCLTVEMPLSERHPFRVEETDDHHLVISLYGVASDTDWIRYDFRDKDLELVTWSQEEPGLYNLKFAFRKAVWGYDIYYDGNTLKLNINKPPQDIDRLKDKIIVIDPGHSLDPGAIGPTGLTEATANLNIALALKKELVKRGARVVMTREDMSDLPLSMRPEIAVAYDADLFISIHNNALPDGVNPLVNHGVSTYYYHPHSIGLARCIQKELIRESKLEDYGLYHGNLAVNRPTQYPAVLVECAFIILPEHEAMLRSTKFQNRLARAIRKGIEKFLEEYDHD